MTQKFATVTIFPSLINSNCGGGSCWCGSSSQPPSEQDPVEELLQRLAEIEETFGDRVQIEVAQYTTLPQLRHALERLNVVFKTSGITSKVSMQNLDLVLMSAAPIIAVNNKIIATGAVPNEEQMLSHLETV